MRLALAALFLLPVLVAACSAAGTEVDKTGADGAAGGAGGGGGSNAMGGAAGSVPSGGSGTCNVCTVAGFVPCDGGGNPGLVMPCPHACKNGVGCVACMPGGFGCVGNDVAACNADGTPGAVDHSCDVANGETCQDGTCHKGCDIAAGSPSNVGCEFWSVDLDQQDYMNDPASTPYGVVLSNAGSIPANVTVEYNDAPPGQPLQLKVLGQISVDAGQLQAVSLGVRELDCGTKPNDYMAPGTCLSSRAYRITSSAPIVVYQFNTFENSFSNDASLLLPTNALGKLHRVLGWNAGHPAYVGFGPYILDRSYVTIVGTTPNTQVTVKPTWRIKGNAPIAKTDPGGVIQVTLGPFDVLNLETDDATLQEAMMPNVADLTGTTVESSEPVAVFSGSESTAVPMFVDIPLPPDMGGDKCCLDHLEEQIFPIESLGKNYVVARSPIRSTSGKYVEPDVLRFLGAAETATVTTSLPAPFDSFTLQPGEVKTTWADGDIVVTATAPIEIAQLLVSQDYVDGPATGDPSLTIFPPVEQYQTEYIFLTPGSWDSNYVVIAAPVGAIVSIDGAAADGTSCVVAPAGYVAGKDYEARRCKVGEGAHHLSGDSPFGIVAYGYGAAGSYAVAGGAAVKRIYTPPPLK